MMMCPLALTRPHDSPLDDSTPSPQIGDLYYDSGDPKIGLYAVSLPFDAACDSTNSLIAQAFQHHCPQLILSTLRTPTATHQPQPSPHAARHQRQPVQHLPRRRRVAAHHARRQHIRPDKVQGGNSLGCCWLSGWLSQPKPHQPSIPHNRPPPSPPEPPFNPPNRPPNPQPPTADQISEIKGVQLDRDVTVVAFKDGRTLELPPGSAAFDGANVRVTWAGLRVLV